MKDPHFLDILNELEKIHMDYPDLRFGAVLQEATDTHSMGKNIDLHDRSSKDILAGIKIFHDITRERRKK